MHNLYPYSVCWHLLGAMEGYTISNTKSVSVIDNH